MHRSNWKVRVLVRSFQFLLRTNGYDDGHGFWVLMEIGGKFPQFPSVGFENCDGPAKLNTLSYQALDLCCSYPNKQDLMRARYLTGSSMPAFISGDLRRFDTKKFTPRFNVNGVSLTLGLPH